MFIFGKFWTEGTPLPKVCYLGCHVDCMIGSIENEWNLIEQQERVIVS